MVNSLCLNALCLINIFKFWFAYYWRNIRDIVYITNVADFIITICKTYITHITKSWIDLAKPLRVLDLTRFADYTNLFCWNKNILHLFLTMNMELKNRDSLNLGKTKYSIFYKRETNALVTL